MVSKVPATTTALWSCYWPVLAAVHRLFLEVRGDEHELLTLFAVCTLVARAGWCGMVPLDVTKARRAHAGSCAALLTSSRVRARPYCDDMLTVLSC